MKELNVIQTALNAPKNKFNSFFNGNYRSAEDIMEALKPLLKETGCHLVCTDEIIVVPCRFEGNSYDEKGREVKTARDGRMFVKATATITNASGESVSATAYAELRDTDKGDKLDPAQRTGSASSYARKYAMGGLLIVDDSKDPDDEGMSRMREEERSRSAAPKSAPKSKPAPKGDGGLPTSTAIFNSLVEAEAQGRLTKDGRQPREWFEKKYGATIPQMRLFDAAVEEARIRMQQSESAEGDFPSSPNADEVFSS